MLLVKRKGKGKRKWLLEKIGNYFNIRSILYINCKQLNRLSNSNVDNIEAEQNVRKFRPSWHSVKLPVSQIGFRHVFFYSVSLCTVFPYEQNKYELRFQRTANFLKEMVLLPATVLYNTSWHLLNIEFRDNIIMKLSQGRQIKLTLSLMYKYVFYHRDVIQFSLCYTPLKEFEISEGMKITLSIYL